MASLTGMTVEELETRLSKMIVSLRVSDTGRIVFKDKGGTETDGGSVGTPSTILAQAYPVGSIFSTTSSIAPEIQLGFPSEWVRFGKGRVLVGIDEADTSFDTIEETGGVKTVTTVPTHYHIQSAFSYVTTAVSGPVSGVATKSINNPSVIAVQTAPNPNAAPHNNMPPYIAVYMWKRTA